VQFLSPAASSLATFFFYPRPPLVSGGRKGLVAEEGCVSGQGQSRLTSQQPLFLLRPPFVP